MIEINNLRKSYGNTEVLHGIKMQFEDSQLHGIMGENGAGKSTLFNCIMNLEKYQGEIRCPEKSSIGFMPDTPFFYPYVTGYEYIEFCLKAKHLPVEKRKILEFNNNVFQLPLSRYAADYSLGMKKRLALLSLMLEDNDILILDEPFNGLDLKATLILKQWLLSLKRDGRNTVISSHITSSLTDICNDIFLLLNGRIEKHYLSATSQEIEADLLTINQLNGKFDELFGN